MRLARMLGQPVGATIQSFAEWILKIGDGAFAEYQDGESLIDIPYEIITPMTSEPVEYIIQAIYPNFLTQSDPINYLYSRAILAPTIDEVDKVNDYMLSHIDSELKTYLSSDSASSSDSDSNDFLHEIHSTVFLNNIKCSGLLSDELKLKVGVPVMLMRNINHSSRLCNGTWLQVTKLGDHIIEALMMHGENAGEKFLILRLTLTPSDISLPFTFQHRQFPLMVSYAMTINKKHGQSLENVGIFLRQPVFTHGQFFVTASRVTSPSGLKFVICVEEGKPMKSALNLIYKEVYPPIVPPDRCWGTSRMACYPFFTKKFILIYSSLALHTCILIATYIAS
ncbi:unnamed protein product [Cuscuta epithymum]|uniref:DNA helicase Pif1-like 2B domain-containing protein n=1 Tax=Cuscuta epithymum TaxID=186058 RepID=A0AAV0C6U7_9ASTE|nr:unnamed protein product [Cuscuta epithymum]CAH9139026.1 unnamed protein product [Cuscuta epithymum]